MQSRTSRGIQYEDVAHAADALLQEGLRPTIERIRMRMGRGSPNTVGPMLEQWFSGLGQRLGGAPMQSAYNEVPTTVVQAAQVLWAAACKEAREQAHNACAEERAALASQAAQLHQERAQLQAQELAWHERLRALESALQTSTEQLQESQQRWQASQHTLAQREAEIAQQRLALAQSAQQCTGLQQRVDQVREQAQQERAALEERSRSSERHWLEEIDRARQEVKKTTLAAQEGSRKLATLQTELEAAGAARHALTLEHATQISALRQELASAQSQTIQAQALLAQLQNAALQPSAATAKPYAISAVRNTSVSARIPRRKLGKNR